jgi:putative oxidoreductase
MTSTARMSRIAIWVLSAMLAFVFLAAGIPKLLGVEAHIQHFARWGYPDWFRVVVGVVETASAVLLLIPRLAFVGAAGIVTIMAGATYTHVIRVPEEAGRAPLTLVLLALAAVVGYARRPRARQPMKQSRLP